MEMEPLIGGKVEIYNTELQRYKKIEQLYHRLDNDLTEYMGFDDEYLRKDNWLMNYNKKDMVKKIHEQRQVIRKLIDELEPTKKEQYLMILQQFDDE